MKASLYRIIGMRGDREWVQMHSIPTLAQAEVNQLRLYDERGDGDDTDYLIELHPTDRLPAQV